MRCWWSAVVGWSAWDLPLPGSGKTLAFLLPLVIHAKQAALKGREGVKQLVVSPTRELAVQSAQVGCKGNSRSC